MTFTDFESNTFDFAIVRHCWSSIELWK
jgi:hypothetical protein